jgi:signal transduction histidine kinase
MDIQNSLSLIAGFVNLGLGLLVLSRGRRSQISFFYSLVAYSVALWCFAVVFFRLSSDPTDFLFWCRVLYSAPVFIVTTFLFFNFVFPNQTFVWDSAKFLSLVPGAVILYLIFKPHTIIEAVVQPPFGEKEIVFGAAYPLYFSYIPVYFSWSFLKLSQRYFTSPSVHRMQIRYVFFGTFLSANLGMVTNLILPSMGNFSVNWLGQVLTIIMSSFIAYAIARYRLMNITLIIKRTIVYSLLLVITFAVYVFVILSSQHSFEGSPGSTIRIVLTAFAVAIGFEPLKKFFQKTTDKIFFKEEYNPKVLLTRLSETMSATIDLGRLCGSVVQIMVKTFNAERMAIFLVEEELASVSVVAEVGFGGLRSLEPNNPLIEYFNIQGIKREFLVYNELERQSAEDPTDQDLAVLVRETGRLGAAMIGPVFSKEKLVGLFVLGNKKSGDIYTEDELSLLGIIFHQAGTSMENAKLYRRVQEQMDELKKNQVQQLMQSAKLASIGELAMSVAHEINNPLTGILGFTSLLIKETSPDDPRVKDLKIIESEALRSRDIVRNLLDFSRSRDPKKEEVNLNEVVKATLVLIRYQAETSNFRIMESYRDDLPFVLADVDQLKQVFINLIKNAFDAMPKGGTLSIETSAEEFSSNPELATIRGIASQQMVMVRFKDEGGGIKPEHLKKIFDPFFTTKANQMGTGLGLAVSYNIVEKHGGRLEVESQLGRGTTFTVKLPALVHDRKSHV